MTRLLKGFPHIGRRIGKGLLTGLLALSLVSFPHTTAESQGPAGELFVTLYSGSLIRLDWSDNLSNEKEFRVERAADSSGYVTIARLPANTTTYFDYNVSPGYGYKYRIIAVDASGSFTVHTNEVSTSTTTVSPPSSLSVSPVSDTQVDLSWTYPGSASYETVIERRTGSGNWYFVARTGRGENSYSDTGLTPNTAYSYRIRAASGNYIYSSWYPGESGSSQAYTKLTPPRLIYGFAMSSSSILLSWTDTYNETCYIIERRVGNAGSYKEIATLPPNTTVWTDTNLEAGILCQYRIKAVAPYSSSEYSNELMVAAVYIPQPSRLSAAAFSTGEVELSWEDNSGMESGFEVWRREENSPLWEVIGTTGRNITGYTDATALPGRQYYYMVRAYSAIDFIYSPFTAPVQVKPSTIAAPSGLDYRVYASSGSTYAIVISWVDNSSSESGFKVEKKTGEEDSFSEITTLTANSTKYIDYGLKERTWYYYRIKVYDNTSNSAAYSQVLEVFIGRPDRPSDLKAACISPEIVRLEWKDNSDVEQGYIIERKSTLKDVYTEIARVGPNTCTYTDSGLTAGITYVYRVSSYNAAGTSQPSIESVATTKRWASFSDVEYRQWAGREILSLASVGILEAAQQNRFKPESYITRSEFVSWTVKAFQLKAPSVGSFPDVNPSHPRYREIMTAKSLGIINGGPGGRFFPDEPITRQDMAVILAKALKAAGKELPVQEPANIEAYPDYSAVSRYAAPSVAALIEKGVLNTRGTGTGRILAPLSAATRAEAAFALYNSIMLE